MAPVKDEIYSREWFLAHDRHRAEFHAIADLLDELFGQRDCIDIGCGMGFILERLDELGWRVTGLDGAKAALECAAARIRDRVSHVDLTIPIDPDEAIAQASLVICTEVAEHLPASSADTLVEHIVRRRRPHQMDVGTGAIFFTAATVGQGGLDHINEQPHEYWISRFQGHGLRLDPILTEAMRVELAKRAPGMSWMGRSAMVFR